MNKSEALAQIKELLPSLFKAEDNPEKNPHAPQPRSSNDNEISKVKALIPSLFHLNPPKKTQISQQDKKKILLSMQPQAPAENSPSPETLPDPSRFILNFYPNSLKTKIDELLKR